MIIENDGSDRESKNSSRVSADLRRHVSHVMLLWCDIFT